MIVAQYFVGIDKKVHRRKCVRPINELVVHLDKNHYKDNYRLTCMTYFRVQRALNIGDSLALSIQFLMVRKVGAMLFYLISAISLSKKSQKFFLAVMLKIRAIFDFHDMAVNVIKRRFAQILPSLVVQLSNLRLA